MSSGPIMTNPPTPPTALAARALAITQVARAAPARPRRGRTDRRGATDLVLVAVVAAIIAIGTLLVWSATGTPGTAGLRQGLVVRHVTNVGVGVVLAAAVVVTDPRYLRILAPLLYLGSVIGLGLVLGMGTTINGSRSWITVGGWSVQPAEFAKLGVVVGIAVLVAERLESRATGRVGSLDVALMLLVAGIPAGLILLQPDLGTMLVLTATVLGLVAMSGASRWWLAGLTVGGLATSVVVVLAGLLKPYQIHRFMAFTDPSLDPRGAGYNTTQARIAIGNGGLFGQGLFGGSQTGSGFVPEQHTDFIFTVAGEELGLVGAGLLVVLYGVVLWRTLRIAVAADDVFGRVAASGVACWFGFQGFQNIGMTLGIMPVTGVPLPFVSYGGSSMFASLLAVGLLLNIERGRVPASAWGRSGRR